MDSIIDSVNKSELIIMYKNKLCDFIPIKQCSLQKMPDKILNYPNTFFFFF